MKVNRHNLTEESFSQRLMEDEFFANYLSNSDFHGYYYDSNDKSYGITLQFRSTGYNIMNLYAIESLGNLSVIEYRIGANDFSIESVAYDKVLITADQYHVESIIPSSQIVQMPQKIEFTLQLMTRHSLFIRFLDSEKYPSPIRAFKSGLVLARETSEGSDGRFAEAYNSDGFFHV
jgi:hypothetical protein